METGAVTDNADRVRAIRHCLDDALEPSLLEVSDESHQHVGHPGAKDGRGHFRVKVVSDAFLGKSRIQRHRLIYQALGQMMETDIHALAIEAVASQEL